MKIIFYSVEKHPKTHESCDWKSGLICQILISELVPS